MGCGPSTKETTLHHWRDPLTALLAADPAVDFQGVILAGTSDEDAHKHFVAGRVGALLEAMRVDGVIISIDSWGNCHIDFASVIQSVGERGIPLAALSFIGQQATFVTSNSYMKSVIDLNKSAEGVENCVLGQNTAVDLDALKALAILKSRIAKKNPDKIRKVSEEKRLRRLILRTYGVKKAELAPETSFDGAILKLNAEALKELALGKVAKEFPQVRDLNIRIIRPGDLDCRVNSILDFMPVGAKVAGRTGDGISHFMSGAQVMLTAVEEGGFQPVNMGGAFGRLGDAVWFDRHATPASSDYIINIDVLLAEGEGRSRAGIIAAHHACDEVLRKVRDALRGLSRSSAARTEEIWDTAREGGLRIALVKLVPGLGCMYDTWLFGNEPCGCAGGRSIMDCSNNVHIMLSPNEYRDGAVRSLT